MTNAQVSVLPVVVQQHAEEAAFLWLLRSDVIRQPHYDLADLIKLDDRIEAHLDGLRVNGAPACQAVTRQAELFGEAGEIFAASVLALESGDRDRLDSLIALAATAELQRGVISSFGWTSSPLASGAMEALRSSVAPVVAESASRLTPFAVKISVRVGHLSFRMTIRACGASHQGSRRIGQERVLVGASPRH